MQFSILQARVAQETGLDVTTDATAIKAWINQAYKQVNGLFNWPWLLKAGTIQTKADITTGTVSINAGSTSLTFSSGPASSVANQYMIQFTATSNDWYFITSHTGGSTSATLGVAFNGSGNISGASYILRKVFTSLPSDVDRIVDLRQARTNVKLGAIDVRTFDKYLPDPTSVADPMYYYLAGLDTSGYWQIGLYPIPSTTENIQIRYLLIPSDMSGDSDLPNIPEKFHDILVYGALYMFGHPYIDDNRYKIAVERYTNLLQEMKLNYNPIPDQADVIQPWDTRPRRLVGRLQWPSAYPEYWR